MIKWLQHIIVLLLLIFGITTAVAQVAMPDTVCVGTPRLYHVNDASIPSTYTWKIDGVTQPATSNEISINWNIAGIFQITVQEHPLIGCDGDIKSGLVYVNPLPVANAGPDSTICFGTTMQLHGTGGTLYNWSPPTYLSNPTSANPIISIPMTGSFDFILHVSSTNGCKSIMADTVSITVLPKPVVFAGNDSVIAINQPLQLNAVDVNHAGLIDYSWSPSFGLNNPSISNPIAVTDRDVTYSVIAYTAQGCEARDLVNIKVLTASEIYVPNAFTPNNDANNNVFRPILRGIKELKYFSVYNRYGELVFTTSKQGAGWDGTFKGKPQNIGAYIWVLDATGYNGSKFIRKGSVVLIR